MHKHENTLLLSMIIFGVGIAISLSYLFYQLDEITLKRYIDLFLPKGVFGVITLLIILSLAISIGLPRQVAAFTAGFSLGLFWGTLLATLAATIGCLITVKFSHLFLRKFVNKRYKNQLIRITHFFSTQTFNKAFVIRLLPAGSNFITNVVAGTAKVPTKSYLLGSSLGFIPQMFIFSLAGSGVRLGEQQQLTISIALFFIALFMGTLLYRRSKFDKI